MDFCCFKECVKACFQSFKLTKIVCKPTYCTDTSIKYFCEYFWTSSKKNLRKLLFFNFSLNFTFRHEINVAIVMYISFIKFLLYIKHGQTKELEVWSNLWKFVVNFVVIFRNLILASFTKDVQGLIRFKESKRFTVIPEF